MNEAKPKILIIDDDLDLLETLRLLLSAENYEVFTSASGKEAEALLDTHRFASILIDIYLPDFDGLEFIARTQRKDIHTPFIVITGSSEIEKARKAIKIGVFDYLLKPIKNRQLIQVVHNAVMHNLLLEERKNLEKQKQLYQAHLEKLVSEKVAELQESELKYKSLVEQSLIGVFVIQDDRFQYLNRKALEIFGEPQSGLIKEQGLLNFFDAQNKELLKEKLEQCLNGERPNIQVNAEACLPDGRCPMLSLWMARIMYKKRPAIEGIVLDITEQNELKKRERLLEIQLMSAHKMAAIGNLVAGIAHNLNTPISIIQANAELLRMRHPDMKELDRILEQTRRMTDLVNTIVMKGKREQSKELENINLNSLIRQELEFLNANLFFKHKVKKELLLKEDLPLVRGRYSDFSQVLNNLVDNAIDAMYDQEEKRLTIETDYDDQFIIIRISDTGCGMDAETQEKIFEPFFTTKINPTKENPPAGVPSGSGLGLSMVKTLLQAYNAQIKVQSAQGQGSTFSIYIPYKAQ